MLKLKLLDSFLSARCEVTLEQGCEIPDLSLIIMQPSLYQGDQFVQAQSLTITSLEAVRRLHTTCEEILEAYKALSESVEEPKPDLPILNLP